MFLRLRNHRRLYTKEINILQQQTLLSMLMSQFICTEVFVQCVRAKNTTVVQKIFSHATHIPRLHVYGVAPMQHPRGHRQPHTWGEKFVQVEWGF